MKRLTQFTFVVGFLMLRLATGAGSAQTSDGYGLTLSVVGDGGQTSRGGNFELVATIELPDAGTMSGGTYALSSEFWAALGSVGPAACVGDCDSSLAVDVSEVVTMANIALGTSPVTDCRRGDASGDGQITIDEILQAVNRALTSCPVG